MASIEKREGKSGQASYRITVCAGYDKQGNKVRTKMSFKPEPGMTERQALKAAQKAAVEFERQINQGYVVDDRHTFAEYADYVVGIKVRGGLKRSTQDSYAALLERINAAIGHMKLKDIRPMHLNQFYESLSESGKREGTERAVPIVDVKAYLKGEHITQVALAEKAGIAKTTVEQICTGKRVNKETAKAVACVLGVKAEKLFRLELNAAPLSAKTVLEYHRLISAVLTQAEKEMLVPYNAAAKATPPKVVRHEVNHFQPEQVRAILTALEEEPLKWRLITELLMITGCRRGEVVGLKWSRIDFEKKRLLIDTAVLSSASKSIYEGPTKTDNIRYIPLPNETIGLLRRHRVAQLELRLANGSRWNNTDFVFTQDNGLPMNPDSVTSWLSNCSKRHGLPHMNPHAFRHTAASVLISQGTDIVTVSKMLGHSRVSTTEDIYSHVIEESMQQASNTLAEVYYKGKAVGE